MYFVSPSKLRRAGVVGMNKRNVVMIAQHNSRRLYPLVDNKLKTKHILEKAGIATPPLLGAIKTQGNVRELEAFLERNPSVVMKPARGSGGKGILVISGKQNGRYVKPSGEEITIQDIRRHASNTLSGLFSLGGSPDVAMLEQMVEFSGAFDGFSYQGVPDIRIIVYKGYPVMAMTRLSTTDSDGKANLHQGAVGLGINLATGKAVKAVQFGRPVTQHPDTKKDLSVFSVPQWKDFVHLASQCYEITTLGYLGVDIVLDKNKGPQILELNARPGLAIQVANGVGLQARVDRIEKQGKDNQSPLKRAEFSMTAFT